jgi:hypothetical protein
MQSDVLRCMYVHAMQHKRLGREVPLNAGQRHVRWRHKQAHGCVLHCTAQGRRQGVL